MRRGRFEAAQRVAAGCALLAALSLTGCGSQSAPDASAPLHRAAERAPVAGLSALDTALLASAAASDDPTPLLISAVSTRADALRAELAAVPFSAASTIPLAGQPGVISSAPAKAPALTPTRPDRFEPDNTQAKASVLHMSSSQDHTISSSKDVDWIALPNDEGTGYYYVVASDQLVIYSKTNPDDGDNLGEETTDENNVDLSPSFAGHFGALGQYSWLKVTAEQPTSHRISYLMMPPDSEVGEESPGVNLMEFTDAVGGLDTREYFKQTGRHATEGELASLRKQLFGTAKDSGGEDYAIDSPEYSPVQRSYQQFSGSKGPVAYWTRSQKRGSKWVVVAAGRDGSWAKTPWEAKLSELTTLDDWSMTNVRYGKPVIYLYPSRVESVTVGLGYRGVLTSSAPAIDPDTHSWTVAARPDGRLTDTAGRTWPYLFWEGVGRAATWDLSTGSVVASADADAYLRSALARLGLSAGESAAFRAFWVPRLQASPYVLIHFEGPAYERIAPLNVTPRPDTQLRVFMVAQLLRAPVPVHAQELGPTPARRGFTLVEWGGTVLGE